MEKLLIECIDDFYKILEQATFKELSLAEIIKIFNKVKKAGDLITEYEKKQKEKEVKVSTREIEKPVKKKKAKKEVSK